MSILRVINGINSTISLANVKQAYHSPRLYSRSVQNLTGSSCGCTFLSVPKAVERGIPPQQSQTRRIKRRELIGQESDLAKRYPVNGVLWPKAIRLAPKSIKVRVESLYLERVPLDQTLPTSPKSII